MRDTIGICLVVGAYVRERGAQILGIVRRTKGFTAMQYSDGGSNIEPNATVAENTAQIHISNISNEDGAPGDSDTENKIFTRF